VVISNPPNDILLLLSILAWVTLDEANEYVRKKDEDLLAELERDTVLEQWISHPLYQSNTKIQLEKMCRDLKIPVKQHSKHELVRLIVEKRKEPIPDVPILYNGDMKTIPTTLPHINKLSVRKLRAIAHQHGVLTCGTKEELSVRVYLLKHGKKDCMFQRERKLLLDLIRITEELIYQESHLKLRAIQHARTYGSVSDTTRNLQGKIFSEFKQSKITPPQTIRSLQDLNELFEPLKDYIGYVKDASKDQITLKQCLSSSESSDSLHEQMTQIGSIVKIKWKQEEVRGTGWKAGWYNAQVQSYNPDTDEIDVVYNQEPDCVYTHDFSTMLNSSTIKLTKSVI